jgi:hypothetical protein
MEAFAVVCLFLVPLLMVILLGLAFAYGVFKEAHIVH